MKYYRKYAFTLMIDCEIDMEIANYIQGRVSSNIGVNHYLAKKQIAIKEYKKFLEVI
jgi:intergrase/recombinase